MGFLSSILPSVVGVGVGAATGNPMLGAAAAGALGYASSGSLSKGLMAGLAGYGGGNLGQALAAQGAQEVAAQKAAEQIGLERAALSRPETFMQTTDIFGNATGAAGFQENLAFQSPNTEMLGKYQQAFQGAYQPGLSTLGAGFSNLGQEGGLSELGSRLGGGMGVAKTAGMMAAPALAASLGKQNTVPAIPTDKSMGQRYAYQPGTTTPMPAPDVPGYDGLGQDFGRQQRYFTPSYRKVSDEEAKGIYGFAAGGIPAIQGAPSNGAVEQMSNANAVGQNTGYPQANIHQGAYATPWQTPVSENMLEGAADVGVNPISGEMNFARGGLSDLGDYSDGGRLLRGPGDGVSDSIPAVIGKKQPARLADGEFVVPARIVSELGNGSTEAGARKLYAMMDRVQQARGKTTGKDKVAKNTRADKYLPA